MYSLERTGKIKIVSWILSIIFLLISILCYFRGGDELLSYGFMNEPFCAVVMVAAFFVALVCALIAVALHAIQKDIAEHLKYLDHKE